MAPHVSYISRPFRPCVGIILINDAKQVFVGQRLDNHGEAWQMPQGGIDRGENAIQAALREMLEEIGTDNAELLREHSDWLNYNIPENLANRLWDGKYQGQTQKWLAFQYRGSDDDININTPHPEFRAWRWASAASLPELAAPFKRQVYVQLLEDFNDLFC